MKRKALGKGLSALLPEEPRDQASGQSLLEVDVDRIDPNPEQPRQHLDDAKLAGLAQSLSQQGVMQPLLVRRAGPRFELIAGERRWRAARKAGLERVPVMIRRAGDKELLELALVENIQREELNPIEEAAAYQRLISEFGYSQEQVASRVAKDRSTVANLVRLLRLPRDIRRLIAEQKLAPGAARPLLSLRSAADQTRIADETVRKGLSVRAVEGLVKRALGEQKQTPKPRRADPNTRDAERRLEEALGTRVRIHRRRGGSGRLEIEFHSEEELSRVFDRLVRRQRGRSSR